MFQRNAEQNNSSEIFLYHCSWLALKTFLELSGYSIYCYFKPVNLSLKSIPIKNNY